MAEEYKYDEDIVDQPDVMLTDDALEEKEQRMDYEQESEMHSLASSMTEKWETGTLDADRIPDLNADRIATSGTTPVPPTPATRMH